MGGKQTHFFILIALLILGGLYVNRLAARDDAFKGEVLLTRFPMAIGEWQGVDEPIGDDVLSILKADAVLFRNYKNKAEETVTLYASYHRSQKEGAQIHSPKNCYPGSGWEIEKSEIIDLTLKGGQKLVVNKLLVSYRQKRQLVLYWYLSAGRVTANDFMHRFDIIRGAILEGRTDGSLIRISTEVGEDVEQTMAKQKQFLDLFYPKLLEYLPN